MMTAVASRVWGWVRPALSYRPWGGKQVPEEEEEEVVVKGGWAWGATAWVWGSWQKRIDAVETDSYWETAESIESLEAELQGAARKGEESAESAPRWWSRVLPSTLLFWPRSSDPAGAGRRDWAGWNRGVRDPDAEGAESDYGTPPPSPTPASPRPLPASPLRLFAGSWTGEVLPEHYEICFNFLRHLFDLLAVGFLWAAAPPVRAVLDAAGLQGAPKLWVHGMVLFLVSTAGMAGVLWAVQEFLPQFALVYGIVQALVISVSVRQRGILGQEEEEEPGERGGEEQDGKEDGEGEAEPVNTAAEGRRGRSAA